MSLLQEEEKVEGKQISENPAAIEQEHLTESIYQMRALFCKKKVLNPKKILQPIFEEKDMKIYQTEFIQNLKHIYKKVHQQIKVADIINNRALRSRRVLRSKINQAR